MKKNDELLLENALPFLDLKRQYLQIKDEILPKVAEVLESASFSGGKYVEEFESNLPISVRLLT